MTIGIMTPMHLTTPRTQHASVPALTGGRRVLGLLVAAALIPAASAPGADPRTIVVPATPADTAPQPVRPNQPPPAAQDLAEDVSPGLLREGAFISNQPARVVQGKSGRWYAIFDGPASGTALPPMILMESSALSSIQRIAERGNSRMRLTGRVSVYRDRNYLLATVAPQIDRVEAAPPPATTPKTQSTGPDMASTPTAKADPSVDDIVAELEKAAPAQRSTGGAGSSAPSPATEAVSEATRLAPAGFLAGRRARVVRGSDGSLLARFDSGPEGKLEAPMTLLPCQNLMQIESLLEAQGVALNAGGESVSFVLTGQVQVYRGRNYLLVTMYMVDKQKGLVNPAP